MKAVLGADPRPNCLVIDEIDGAPQVISHSGYINRVYQMSRFNTEFIE